MPPSPPHTAQGAPQRAPQFSTMNKKKEENEEHRLRRKTQRPTRRGVTSQRLRDFITVEVQPPIFDDDINERDKDNRDNASEGGGQAGIGDEACVIEGDRTRSSKA